MKKISAFLTGVLLFLTPVSVKAYIGLCCRHCGGNMPLNIPGGGIPEPYEWRFKVSGLYMNMAGLRDGTNDKKASRLIDKPMKMSMGMSGMNMDRYMAVPTDMRMRMSSLSTGYSFSDDFAGMVMFMYGQKEMDMKFGAMMNNNTGRSGFTMRARGMADTMLMTKYRIYADDEFAPADQASLLLGVSLPTGSINGKFDNHPDNSQNGNTQPYGMQMGSGTFDPAVGLLYQSSAAPLPIWWGIDLQYTARLYDNPRSYRLGDTIRYDLYGMYQLRYDTVLQVQLNGNYQGKIRGELDTGERDGVGHFSGDSGNPFTTPLYDPDNYGGHKIGFTAGIQWQPVPLHIVDLSFSLPLYQNLNGIQLKREYQVMLTWYIELPTSRSRRFVGK
ncbi:MAG: hypothetical protein ACE5GM_03330 [bacterium]